MKNRKGITLISLVITIIVLLILASIGTYSGINIIKSSKLTAFTTELKIMQTQVNTIYQENKGANIGEELAGNIGIQANKVFAELKKDEKSGINSSDGYRYWSNRTIKELGIEGIEQDFFINLEKRSVVSCQGIEYEGKTYYTLSQMPNGLYNVEYVAPSEEKPTFDVNVEYIGSNKWRITVDNIQYNGYINKWQVQYQLKEDSYWRISEDLSFVVNTEGNYRIKIVNGNIQSEEQNFSITYTNNLEQLNEMTGKEA